MENLAFKFDQSSRMTRRFYYLFIPQHKKPCVRTYSGTWFLSYGNVVNYGFVDFECREYHSKREFNADDYVSYIGTHCDHIVLKEPYKSKFYKGIRDAIMKNGNKIIFNDTIVLYLARKAEM